MLPVIPPYARLPCILFICRAREQDVVLFFRGRRRLPVLRLWGLTAFLRSTSLMRRTFGVRTTTRDDHASQQPGFATSANRTWRTHWLAASAAMCLFQINSAEAQVATSANRAMPGLVHLGAPLRDERSVAVAAGVGVGWLDRAQNASPGSRVVGQLAASVDVLPTLTLGADFLAHRDAFGGEVNGYGEPRVSARYVGAGTADHAWGLQLDARFVGGEAPSIEWAATSPSLRALYGYRANPRLWALAELGVHVNRSAEAVPDLEPIPANDRRSLHASTWSGVPWGVGLGHQLFTDTFLSGELTGEWLVGEGAPGPFVSPLKVSAGVQQMLGDSLAAFISVDVALSRRRGLVSNQVLVEEPRLQCLLGVTWLSAKPPPPPRSAGVFSAPPPAATKPEPKAPASVTEPPPVALEPILGTIVDEGGRPMADVEVTLQVPGQPPRTERTFADGRFEFGGVPIGSATLAVNEPGYESATVEVGQEPPRSAEIVLRPAVPAGQVRGRVLDLQGLPVSARITVANETGSSAASEVVVAASDGSFELDLVPGRYVVRFEHDAFAPQRRSIVVKDKGVVILNIALIR